MNPTTNLALVVALGATLLTLAAIAFAGIVWQRRRHAATSAGRRRGRLGSLACLVASALLLAVSLTVHLLVSRTGNLHAHDLVVVRSEPDRGIPRFVADLGQDLAPGDLLLRFDRPASVAELRAMEIELQSARSARDRILASTLDINPRLSREKTRLEADHRHLVQRREAGRSALGYTETQIRIEILAQQARTHDVSTEIERIRGRLAGNRSELAYAKAVANSRTDLERHQLVSPLNAQQGSRDVETLASRAEQLQREQSRQEMLRGELEPGVAALRARLDRHREDVQAELENIDAELVRLCARRGTLAAEIRADLERLEKLRAAQLDEQELKARAIEVRMEQKRHELRVAAPVEGRVLYMHPAPAATPAHEPILAFGSNDAVRVHIKVRRAEGGYLAEAGPIELRTTAQIDEPSLEGTFLTMRDVRSEPGLVLVELSCEPSQSAMRELVEGGRLDVELNWAPPIYVDPVFGLGLIFLVCYVALQIRSRQRQRTTAPPPLPSETPAVAQSPLAT